MKRTRWNGNTLAQVRDDLDVKTSTASDFCGAARRFTSATIPNAHRQITRIQPATAKTIFATTTARFLAQKKRGISTSARWTRMKKTPRATFIMTHLQARFRHGGVHANGSGATESERTCLFYVLRSKVVLCVICNDAFGKMPPNFICFFLSFLSSALPQKKTRDWFLLKTRKAGKGAKQKEQKTRDGRLIKIEKTEITSPLSSLTSLSSFVKAGGRVKTYK